MPSKKREQLCWSCANACCGCSWSRWFEPVEGWTAKKTVIIQAGYQTESYEITACPEYVEDIRQYRIERPKYSVYDLDIALAKGDGDINKGVNRRIADRIPEMRLRSYLPELKPIEQNVVMICVIKNLTIEARSISARNSSDVHCVRSSL